MANNDKPPDINFEGFCSKYLHNDEDAINLLQEEELDDIKELLLVEKEQVHKFHLKIGTKKALLRGIHELKSNTVENPFSEKDIDMFFIENSIPLKSKQILIDNGVKNIADLAEFDSSELQTLGIKTGSINKIKRGINDLKKEQGIIDDSQQGNTQGQLVADKEGVNRDQSTHKKLDDSLNRDGETETEANYEREASEPQVQQEQISGYAQVNVEVQRLKENKLNQDLDLSSEAFVDATESPGVNTDEKPHNKLESSPNIDGETETEAHDEREALEPQVQQEQVSGYAQVNVEVQRLKENKLNQDLDSSSEAFVDATESPGVNEEQPDFNKIEDTSEKDGKIETRENNETGTPGKEKEEKRISDPSEVQTLGTNINQYAIASTQNVLYAPESSPERLLGYNIAEIEKETFQAEDKTNLKENQPIQSLSKESRLNTKDNQNQCDIQSSKTKREHESLEVQKQSEKAKKPLTKESLQVGKVGNKKQRGKNPRGKGFEQKAVKEKTPGQKPQSEISRKPQDTGSFHSALFSKEKCTIVNFYATESVKNINNYTMCMTCDSVEFGHWKIDYDLSLHRKISNKICVYHLSLAIPKSLLGRFVYKYKFKNVSTVQWEHNYWHYRNLNRVMQLKDTEKQNDNWDQYDVVIDKYEDFKDVALSAFPEWKGFSKKNFGYNIVETAGDACRLITQMMRTMEPTFQPNDTNLRKALIRSYLDDRLHMLATSKNISIELKQARLATAVGLVWLIEKFGLSESIQKEEGSWKNWIKDRIWKPEDLSITDKQVEGICKALLINPEENQCSVARDLKSEFKDPKMFGDISRNLKMFLQHICNRNFFQQRWVYGLPLLHFITNELHGSVNENEPLTGTKRRQSNWWGISGVEECVQYCSRYASIPEDFPNDDCYKKLLNLFEADLLLARTIIATVSHEQLGKIYECPKFPVDCLVANLLYMLSNSTYINKHTLCLLEYTHAKVMQQGENIKTQKSDERMLNINKEHSCLAVKLLKEIHKNVHNTGDYGKVFLGLEIVAAFSKQQRLCLQEYKEVDSNTYNTFEVTYREHYDITVKSVEEWLQITLKENVVIINPGMPAMMAERYECEIYSKFLQIEWDDKELQDMWKKTILTVYENRLDKLGIKTKFELFITSERQDNLHPMLEEILSKIAVDALTTTSVRVHDYEFMLSDDYIKKGSKLLQKIFKDVWPKRKDQSAEDHRIQLVEHMLNWQAFPKYLAIKNTHSKYLDSIKDELQEATEIWTHMISELKSGDIEIRYLRILLKKKDGMKIICSELNIADVLKEVDISSLLNARERELFKIDKCKSEVTFFLALTSQIPGKVDTETLRKKCEQNFEGLKLSTACKPITNDYEYNPVEVIIFNDVTENLLMKIGPIYTARESLTFLKIWEANSRDESNKAEIDGRTMSLEEVLDNVASSSLDKFTEVTQTLHKGTITFAEIEVWFIDTVDLLKEFESMAIFHNMDTEWCMDRTGQIENYHRVSKSKRGAKAMDNFRNVYGLTGDFTQLDTLLSWENKENTLDSMNDDTVQVSELLSELTDERISCINLLTKSQSFIQWIKESIKDIKEVKVFVDLAMIKTTGQGDHEVEKVSCLQATVLGFAPLIYELNVESGLKELMDCFVNVWKNLDADKKLPKKLQDTVRHLDWLKQIIDARGSVEVSSLTQAELINARGIYLVGELPKRTDDIEQKSLSSVIQLTLPPEEDKDGQQSSSGRWQTYSYQELSDLQSKLMLIAGKAEKGKEQVDRFVEVFDGICRLGNTYIELCHAGSLLFKDFSVKFHCDKRKKINTVLSFGLSKKTMQGSSEKDVAHQITELCEFLDNCLKDWMEDMDHKRKKFYYLNHFTTEQLVILRNELAKLSSKKSDVVSASIYPLLESIQINCKRQDIDRAIERTFKDLALEQRRTEKEAKDESFQKDRSSLESRFNKEDVKMFFNELLPLYPRELVLAALKEHGPDPDEGMIFCMDDANIQRVMHGNDNKQPEEDDVSKFLGKDDLVKLADDIYTDLLRDESHIKFNIIYASSLKEKLEKMWRKYFDELEIQGAADYMSVSHIGQILQHLANAEEGTETAAQREMPGWLQKGKPNLIVCKQDELFQTLLSVYMYGDNRELPLPTEAEVLVCTASTTSEQIDLLFRRACDYIPNGEKGKIFCLANVNELDFEISTKAERSFEKHSKGKTDYRLVVICSKEKEDKSSIVTAFDRWRVRHSIDCEVKEVKSYVLKHVMKNDDVQRSSVLVIKSQRAGVGKSLKARRLAEHLVGSKENCFHTVYLHKRIVDVSDVAKDLIKYLHDPEDSDPRMYHINIAQEVQENLDTFLFNLTILGCVTDRNGYMWRRKNTDYTVLEAMPLVKESKENENVMMKLYHHTIFHLLPVITCWSPQDSYCIMKKKDQNAPISDSYPECSEYDQLMDDREFKSEKWQRVYQYLERETNKKSMDTIDPSKPEGTVTGCLEILLQKCGIVNPSWSELQHFVHFLNIQLKDCENSVFCQDFLAPDLPGFKQFVVKSMIQMSRDFATRSLNMSEETEQKFENNFDIEKYQMKRTWESSPHPYVFFNYDSTTMTFVGFNIDGNGDMVDSNTKKVIEKKIMPKPLIIGLTGQGVPLNENFDDLQRQEKIRRLCNVMGVENYNYDPDPTYVLTTDNVKKMLAIFMRLRCDIPVIVMGETGCGKTRLVKFLCELQKPTKIPEDVKKPIENLILIKVHGGTTEDDIERKLNAAKDIAKENSKYFKYMQTILFFDETNTTEAIGLIKNVMCDDKYKHQLGTLKIVAACNPYRMHSKEMIDRLENAGLGYHVQSEDTKERLGKIPMRRLVYRVQPLPQSLLPLVWDFGQLSINTEKLYIQEMVERYIKEKKIPYRPDLAMVLSKIFAKSQEYMRDQNDECSFVSLRDVERALSVLVWFYNRKDDLFNMMDEIAENEVDNYVALDDVTRSLVLALGVCYHACLQQKRQTYCDFIAQYFKTPCELGAKAKKILAEEINRCQDVFIENIDLPKNIAKNRALKENIFMMVICTELRIPLFLVGKPGSSKSLAKTIIADEMQGDAAKSELFKLFKLLQMVSFQCSPLSTPAGIIEVFRQCATLQQHKDRNKYVSVVVLDEIGLAEDSPRMPLKALHPLLEDGCLDDNPEPYMKVGFVGISNWALDPAKMNRGILLQRGVPDEKELEDSARGICSQDKQVQMHMVDLLRPMSLAYLDIYKSAHEIREFFGLRDFYSLVKMVYCFAKKRNGKPTYQEVKHAVLRNFGGLEKLGKRDSFAYFNDHICHLDVTDEGIEYHADCSPLGLIMASLKGSGVEEINSEGRYLLILTENKGALRLLQHHLLEIEDGVIIFGSNFPKDQQYTQICRNINRVKICMETGHTVILLNLENLYESLYDALNQYYVYLGGQKFVDLGLGSHRVKCRVDDNFRLIVIAEKDTVYKRFPIPLINRLEKHILHMNTVLNPEQRLVAGQLQGWVRDYASQKIHGENCLPEDIFIGYDRETPAALVIQATDIDPNIRQKNMAPEILNKCKLWLLQCATPEAVVRVSFKGTPKQAQDETVKHNSLAELLKHVILDERLEHDIHAQVTTHSKLLTSNKDIDDLKKRLGIDDSQISLYSMQAFSTEQQFCKVLREFYNTKTNGPSLLLLQCDSGDTNSALIESATYYVLEERITREPIQKHVVFVIQLPRKLGGCHVGFQGGQWLSFHLDELRMYDEDLPNIELLAKTSVSDLFTLACEENQQTHEMTKKLPLKALLLNSIYGATVILSDDKLQSKRKIARVGILKKAILHASPEGPNSLVNTLAKRIAILLKQLEDTRMLPEAVTKWLFKASVHEVVVKAGTFRRSIWERLQERVVPLLAGVLANIDANANLDIPNETQLESWQHKLWLKMLTHPEIVMLNFEDMADVLKPEKTITVAKHGFQGGVFKCKFPFSWIVKDNVDKVIYQAEASEISYIGRDDINLDKLFEESPLGKSISSCVSEIDHEDMIKTYLHDYVRMIYKPISHILEMREKENELLEKSILESSKKNSADSHVTIPEIHKTFQQVHGNIDIFGEVVSLQPSVVDVLSEGIAKQELNKEFILDRLAVVALTESMQPISKDTVNKPENRIKWINNVEMCFPFLERVLGIWALEIQNMDDEQSPKVRYYKRCRSMWTRICSLHLFIQHVCRPGADEEDLGIKNCFTLFKLLGEDVDFKTCATLSKVERVLKICNKNANQKFYGILQTCGNCQEPILSAVQLPCEHRMCDKCFIESKQTDRKCSECKAEYDSGYDPPPLTETSEARENYAQFRDRCNSFFMDMIARFCFSGDKPPDNELIEKLLGYVTKEKGKHHDDGQGDTKKSTINTSSLNVFGDSVDATPCVRSFLLQQILRSQLVDVREFVRNYFTRMKSIMEKDKENVKRSVTELSLLFVYCLEDTFLRNYRNEENEIAQISLVDQMLKYGSENLHRENLCVEKLEAIASLRCALQCIAEWLAKGSYNTKIQRSKIDITTQLHNILTAEESQSWLRIYLVKQIYRRWGKDAVIKVIETEEFSWLLDNEDDKQELQKTDRMAVLGGSYISVRENLKKCLLNIGPDANMLQEPGLTDITQGRYILLAVYSEVLIKYTKSDKKEILDETEVGIISNILNKVGTIQNKQLLNKVLSNTLGMHFPKMNLSTKLNPEHYLIVELLIHFCINFSQIQVNNNQILTSFDILMNNPEEMQASFLPSMPYTDLKSLMNELYVAFGQGLGTTLWKCKNGHIYIVGNCGRPVQNAKCLECGEPIGGASYNVAVAGAQKIEANDSEFAGHILGHPQFRSEQPPQERLSTLGTVISRFVLHCAMLLGANIHPEKTAKCIKPDITNNVGDVPVYIWDHLLLDFRGIQTAIGRSPDETLIVLHLLLDRMFNLDLNETIEEARLQTPLSRNNWEKQFEKNYMKPILEDIPNLLGKANADILVDNQTNVGGKLLGQMYDINLQENADENMEHIQINPFMWRFRTTVTIEHMAQIIQQTNEKDYGQLNVLRLFLRKENLLRPLKYLPKVIKLQRMLTQKFTCGIANRDTTIQTFLQDQPEGPLKDQFTDLIDTFFKVWNDIRHYLNESGASRGIRLPEPYYEEDATVTRNISMLIPDERGEGRCSLVLLYFLVTTQNEFMEEYSRIKDEKLPKEIKTTDVMPAHIISYHHEKDLLPIVLANCDYSLTKGKETDIQYNFEGLQQQIEERFIRGKLVIKPQKEDVLPEQEVSTAKRFERLHKLITQESIEHSAQQQIKGECRQILEVNDSLGNLEIAIGFLVSVGGESQMKLADFMGTTLSMEKPLHSEKALQRCTLANVQHLWLILWHERTKLLTKLGQKIFEAIPESYHKPLEEDQKKELEVVLQRTNMDVFLNELYEFILLKAVPDGNQTDDNYQDNTTFPLGYTLMEYLEERTKPEIAMLTDATFPSSITVSQCISVWQAGFVMLNPDK